MRTGVLADDVALRKFAPPSQDVHDVYLTRPHLATHGRHVKPRKKGRDRVSARPRAPYMAMHEYAQILNPQNVAPFVDAFGGRLHAHLTYQPPVEFQTIVQRFNETNPQFSTDKGMKPETAYFLQTLADSGYHVSLEDHFVTDRTRMPSAPRMRKPLATVLEQEYNENATTDVALQTKMHAVYEEAIRHVTAPVPRNASMGISSTSSSAQPSLQSSPTQAPLIPPPPSSPNFRLRPSDTVTSPVE